MRSANTFRVHAHCQNAASYRWDLKVAQSYAGMLTLFQIVSPRSAVQGCS